MTKSKKRKPDLRRIQTSRSYTVEEIAHKLNKTTGTVRSWIRQGLQVLPDTSPRLIDGQVLKNWLADKWADRKQTCVLGELYCCKCRAPRTPHPASVSTSSRTMNTALIKGTCSQCGTVMQQARSLSKLAEIITAMTSVKTQQANLSDYEKPSVKPTDWKGQAAFDFDQWEGDPKHVH